MNDLINKEEGRTAGSVLDVPEQSMDSQARVSRSPAPEEHAQPREFNVVVLPGDGIGAEVMAEGIKVVEAISRELESVRFRLTEYSVGAVEYLRSGHPLPDASFEACERADAILLGAVGLPDVRWPDGKEMTPQIDLRERLDLYCGVRPVRLFHAGDTPLRGLEDGSIDLVVIRESTEGLFSARLSKKNGSNTECFDTLRVTRRGSERVFRAAFTQARRRRRKVTLVDKANVLPSMVFFREVFDEVAREFPEVQAERLYVDAAALHLVRRPRDFDVVVTENMFGDILSDLAAGLVGGMGMVPSADLGDRSAVFQPAHGTAPEIAGRGIANPIAMILSVAMLFEWLGHPDLIRGAARILRAVEQVLAEPRHRTPDMNGTLTTAAMGDLIVEHL